MRAAVWRESAESRQTSHPYNFPWAAICMKAMFSVWERLAEVLGHFTDKLSSDASLRPAMINNLEEIVALLPDLNVLNDPDLEAIRQRIDDKLTGYDVKQFRDDKHTRKAVATEAQAIMEEMSGFMKAFGGK